MYHPVAIVTKNALVTRDRDLLAGLAREQCALVYVSLTTLDSALAGKLEPRASRPAHRLRAIRGGQCNVSDWGRRIKGDGIFAEQISALFEVAARRAGLNRGPPALSTAHFRRPGEQLNLF